MLRDVDKLIRSVFRKEKHGYSATVKDEIWENIEASLDAGKAEGSNRTIALMVAAALLFSAAGVYFVYEKQKPVIHAKTITSSYQKFSTFSHTITEKNIENNKEDFNNRTQKKIIAGGVNTLGFWVPLHQLRKGRYNEKNEIALAEPQTNFINKGADKNIPAYANVYYRSIEATIINHTSPLLKTLVLPDVNKLQNPALWLSQFTDFSNNPALAGFTPYITLGVKSGYEKFPGFGKAEIFNAVSAEVFSSKIHSGFGLSYNQKIKPVMTDKTLNLSYSYKQKLNNNLALRLGLAGTYTTSEITYLAHGNRHHDNLFSIGSATNKSSKDINSLHTQIQLHTGVAIESKHLMAGLSVKNLNRSANYYGEKTPVEYSAFAAHHFYFKDVNITTCAEAISVEEGKNISVNMYASYKKLMLGGGYNKIDFASGYGSPAVYAGVQFCKGVSAYFSYGQGSAWTEYGVPKNIFSGGMRIQVR